MPEFIATFGFGQELQGCFCRIDAEDIGDAQDKMMEEYGTCWSHIYESEKDAGVEWWDLEEVEFGTENSRVR